MRVGGIRKYVMALHVPIYTDGDDTFVATDWKRSLELLRDSFGSEVGEFVYVGPRATLESGADQRVERFGSDDGWRLRPSFDYRASPGRYWAVERSRWREDARKEMADASIVHLGMNDLFRPINFDALQIGLRSSAKSVFVRDTDEVLKIRELLATGVIKRKPYWPAYLSLYERAMRFAVSRADLSLLKGQALFERYRRFARNAHSFENTSFSEKNIVSMDALRARIQGVVDGRPLRFVYCGRLETRKGVDRSIELVSELRAAGEEVSFDIIGDGEQRSALETQVQELRIGDRVRFLGRRDYGASLLSELADYDGLLFTPLAEDTPRMIFDGYCAGLPLVGHDIA